MALSKKELRDIKRNLIKSNPGVVSSIRNRNQVITVASNEEEKNKKKRAKPKSVVKWNFGINDLVEVHMSRSYNFKSNEPNIPIGLIISDFIYRSSKVEKNNFFVLVENRVIQLDGKYLRRV
jgi:hypothetical protein